MSVDPLFFQTKTAVSFEEFSSMKIDILFTLELEFEYQINCSLGFCLTSSTFVYFKVCGPLILNLHNSLTNML